MTLTSDYIRFQIRKHAKILRYLFSGGTSAVVDLVLLHVFVEYFHIWYIISAALAYLIAFWVSFVMQKYWTFQNTDKTRIHKQIVMHFSLGATNLLLNTVIMYVLVDFAHVPYLLAQIISSGGLAIISFTLYKKYIFKNV